MEPNLNVNIMSAIRVPDGTIDPFRLCSANILDAIPVFSMTSFTILTGCILAKLIYFTIFLLFCQSNLSAFSTTVKYGFFRINEPFFCSCWTKCQKLNTFFVIDQILYTTYSRLASTQKTRISNIEIRNKFKAQKQNV